MTGYCTGCGVEFEGTRSTGGRPRTRCDQCRSNYARNDGRAWRELRALVLAEEPICTVLGCRRPSTQVDHIVPLNLRPDLGLERGNLRGICATHNASKGARLGDQAPGPVAGRRGRRQPSADRGRTGTGFTL